MKSYLILILLNFFYSIKIKAKTSEVDITFEYPYTCGTWFNRGKNTCNDIKEAIERTTGIKVNSSVHAFHVGEVSDYNGFFNIYLNKNGSKILLATSDESSQVFHSGLKYFAYTFYNRDENGERNYMETFPQKADLLQFVVKRTIDSLNFK